MSEHSTPSDDNDDDPKPTQPTIAKANEAVDLLCGFLQCEEDGEADLNVLCATNRRLIKNNFDRCENSRQKEITEFFAPS